MANPQYPMQPMPGQMPHQQMQQPGMPPLQNPLKGTSRAVPVVVSAGLAIGVFCGLLFGLGTGGRVAAAPSKGNNVKPLDPSETTSQPTITSPKGDPSTVKPTVKPTVAPTAAAKGAPTIPANTAPAPNKAKIIVELKPDTIAAIAKITVDDHEIIGGMLDLDLGAANKKEVKLVVKASGYRDHEQKVEVEGDTTVKIEMIKRASSGGTGTGGGLKRPPPPGGKKKPPGDGLIDI